MPDRTKTRRLDVFTINAHVDDEPVDYSAFFHAISRIPEAERRHETRDLVIALVGYKIRSEYVSFIAVEGERGMKPLIYDPEEGRLRIGDMDDQEVLATKTHCVVHTGRHEMAVEYNHRGAKARQIAYVLEQLARRDETFAAVEVSAVPVLAEEFLEALAEFERIHSATVRVVRPNPGWSTHRTSLMRLLGDSQGRRADMTVVAPRNGSLSPDEGIVGEIKECVEEGITTLDYAVIKGTRRGESGETTLPLDRHQVHTWATASVTPEGHVNDRDIERRLLEYMRNRVEQEGM